MSAPKWILMGSVVLFSIIGVTAIVKKGIFKPAQRKAPIIAQAERPPVVETPIVSIPVVAKVAPTQPVVVPQAKEEMKKTKKSKTSVVPSPALARPNHPLKDDFPNIDRIFQLFTTGPSKLPLVETLSYSSSVPWLKGRPAWVADYATHYNTSRHFIARSLNNKPDYFSQKVSEGSKFNVFRKDKKIHFHLLVDVSRCKMGFYYVDLNTNERVLLKSYRVGLGRLDPTQPSGCLTPLGRYTLGERVAIYQPGVTSFYQDQKVEMIRIFGTRWIPLEQEIEQVKTPVKGYGLQGAPWVDSGGGQLTENKEVIGAYHSGGCICLSSEDIEELFAIVLTKPAFVEIVKDFHDAKLPGVEVATPSR